MIRTLPQILAQIRQDDPNTSITYYALRNHVRQKRSSVLPRW